MRLRPGLHYDSTTPLLTTLLIVLRSVFGQTGCLIEDELIAYKPYTDHLKRARAAPVRERQRLSWLTAMQWCSFSSVMLEDSMSD